MDHWYKLIEQSRELSESILKELDEVGFIIIPGPVSPDQVLELAAAYDSAVLNAHPSDVSVGRSTTRVNDFVNRGELFDDLYIFAPLLEACCRTIRQPFKLSTMHARTVRPFVEAQDLHVDFRSDENGWPMVGFILMVDEFRDDNGATRFVANSHRMVVTNSELPRDEVLALGPAGSMVIYNGSIWHGHTANRTDQPRRSIQGAFIRRDPEQAVKQSARAQLDTLGRIKDLHKYLLDL